MEELIIQPFNPTYAIRESGTYQIVTEEDSDNSIILSHDEVNFILKYRESSSDTRAMVRTLLDSTRESN